MHYNVDVIVIAVPGPPVIDGQKSTVVNDTITFVWDSNDKSNITGYVLELDDGKGGNFKVCLRTVHDIHRFLSYWEQKIERVEESPTISGAVQNRTSLIPQRPSSMIFALTCSENVHA